MRSSVRIARGVSYTSKGCLLPIAIVVLLTSAFVGTAMAGPNPAPCSFQLGFKTLHDLVPDVVGDCVTDAEPQPNGDVQQHSANGLLAWRKADNWTAFTNGARTWINGPCGLQDRSNDDRFAWEQGGSCAPPTSGAPRFNPDAFAGSGPVCFDTPPVSLDRSWQVSAPRGIPGPTRPGDIVELGLRNKFGGADEVYYVSARVIAPNGSATVATAVLSAAQWAYVYYPTDFTGAAPVSAGTYTVVWETNGGFLACDGFVAESY